jgi:hypothetical protein
MISILTLVILAIIAAAVFNSGIGHMVVGGVIALILFHPQAQELREILIMAYEKLVPEITRAATDAIEPK